MAADQKVMIFNGGLGGFGDGQRDAHKAGDQGIINRINKGNCGCDNRQDNVEMEDKSLQDPIGLGRGGQGGGGGQDHNDRAFDGDGEAHDDAQRGQHGDGLGQAGRWSFE